MTILDTHYEISYPDSLKRLGEALISTNKKIISQLISEFPSLKVEIQKSPGWRGSPDYITRVLHYKVTLPLSYYLLDMRYRKETNIEAQGSVNTVELLQQKLKLIKNLSEMEINLFSKIDKPVGFPYSANPINFFLRQCHAQMDEQTDSLVVEIIKQLLVNKGQIDEETLATIPNLPVLAQSFVLTKIKRFKIKTRLGSALLTSLNNDTLINLIRSGVIKEANGLDYSPMQLVLESPRHSTQAKCNIIEHLSKYGVQNANDKYNATPLLNKAIYMEHLAFVELLVDLGADIESTDNRGYTALHCAARLGNTQITKYLIKKGANTKARIFANGNTPYLLANAFRHEHLESLLSGEV